MLAARVAAATAESSNFVPVNTTEENPAAGVVPVKPGIVLGRPIPTARVVAKAAMGASHVISAVVEADGDSKVAVRAPKRVALAASPAVVGAMTMADA